MIDKLSLLSFIVYALPSSAEKWDNSSRSFALSLPLSIMPPDSLIQRGNFCIFKPFDLRYRMNCMYCSASYHFRLLSSQYTIHISIVFWKNALSLSSSSAILYGLIIKLLNFRISNRGINFSKFIRKKFRSLAYYRSYHMLTSFHNRKDS